MSACVAYGFQMTDPFALRAVLPVPPMDDVVVETRTTTTGRALDVYRRARLEADPAPAVLFVPGDGPEEVIANAKDWGQYVSWGRLAASRGLVAVTMNHRSTNQYSDLEGAAQDVDAAVDWVRSSGVALGIDPERIAIWTCSAGGPMALRTVLRDRPSCVRALVALYSVLDLRGASEQFSPPVSEEVLAEFSPARYLELGGAFPPMFVVRAGRDREAINRSIERFVATAVESGVDLEYINYAGGQHAFDIRDDTARARAIIRRTLDFLSQALLHEG